MNTAALILETHNLGSASGRAARWLSTLCSCLTHLSSQTLPLSALKALIVTYKAVPIAASDVQAQVNAAAGREVMLVELDEKVDYYEAKNRGFDASDAELVVFGDTDCVPDSEWLERLLAPFRDPAVEVVAGRTTYRRDWLGAAASTIDFMYFESPLGTDCTRNFYANNVAFRRGLFARYRFEASPGVYRGHCQLLGLALQAAQVKVRFVPEARTIHRFPDSVAGFVRLRLLRGQDAAQLGPHLMRTYAPAPLHARADNPVVPLVVLGTRFGYSVASVNRQQMPEVHGLGRAKTVAAIAAVSALDVFGALLQTIGAPIGDGTHEALEYHSNREGLTSTQLS